MPFPRTAQSLPHAVIRLLHGVLGHWRDIWWFTLCIPDASTIIVYRGCTAWLDYYVKPPQPQPPPPASILGILTLQNQKQT